MHLIYVDVKDKAWLWVGVLTQMLGPLNKSVVADFFEHSDMVARSWCPCLRAGAATSLLIKEVKRKYGSTEDSLDPASGLRFIRNQRTSVAVPAQNTTISSHLPDPPQLWLKPHRTLNPATLLPDLAPPPPTVAQKEPIKSQVAEISQVDPWPARRKADLYMAASNGQERQGRGVPECSCRG